MLLQPVPPDQIVLYSPAVERLGVIQIRDEHIFNQVETGQMIATIYGDLETVHDGRRKISIALLPIGP